MYLFVFSEIVYIGAIHTQHYVLAMMMLSEGKHVLCEKPLTMSLADTTKLISYAKSKNLFLMEGVWSRCFPIYDAIREKLADGCVGDIRHVFASFGFDLSDVDRIKFVTFSNNRTCNGNIAYFNGD